jgi:two-component system, cell cycle sensor histidine kinase and response regulator CckA
VAIRGSGWKYVRGLAPPVLILAAVVGWLGYLIVSRIHWSQQADEANMREWLDETVVFRNPLRTLVRDYLDQPDTVKAQEITQQLKAMGDPTRMYQGQLPLFPVIYRLEIRFKKDLSLPGIFWDSYLPRPYGPVDADKESRVLRGSVRINPIDSMDHRLLGEADDRAVLHVDYQLHAYNKRQQVEEQRQASVLAVSILAAAAVVLVVLWGYFFLRRERQRELTQLQAQQQIEHAEKMALENELRVQEAERKHEEAERQALELKSQFYASISIMAGSYAHNIKNLLVRPNDLLSRCLEGDGMSPDQEGMLVEVRHTLGTVTERLQQILRTVRRDPSRAEMTPLDLNQLVADIQTTWQDLARDKWKLNLQVELHSEPLLIQADHSHLQQAIENLLFNARDATFEMRNHLRNQARQKDGQPADARKQALIDAAAWKGTIVIRTRKQDGQAVLEVEDNGVGMTEEVRRRCTETYFTTKRDNAVYEGNTTGMGLGLSFVVVILEHHQAKLEIDSEHLKGTRFRVAFPLGQEER